jgi:hypothetical protein
MNSWNCSTSYAKNIKISQVKFPDNETKDRAYGLLDVDAAFREFNMILQMFAEKHNFEWQIGRNGRSGGYLVLYQGYAKKSDYKRCCHDCGQKNFNKAATECGCCHSDNMHDYEGMKTGMWGGRSTDQGEDFSDFDWDMVALRDRVKLVKDFDKTCDKAVKSFIDFCKGHEATEEEIMVPKTIAVAVDI